MTVIELPDEQAALLQAKAAAQGLSLQAWLQRLADEERMAHASPHPLQAVANIVLDCMREVPEEDSANRPKDGAAEHDHYLYGHPRRNS